MTTFYLIRHAEREGDQAMLAGRMPGLHLTAHGRVQAARLARHLAREPIEHILSSPLERTRETAEPLAAARGVNVGISDAIGEIEAGRWTGRMFPELDASDEEWRRFNRFRSGTRIPGGESAIAVQHRFVGEMLRVRNQHPNTGVALVSHADPIKIALACLLGAPLDFYDRLEIGLASVSVVTVDDWGAKVLRLNDRVPEEER